MSSEEEIAQLQLAIERALEESAKAIKSTKSAISEQAAKESVRREEDYYRKDIHSERIADMQSARAQRVKYARWVFLLVAGWICALFAILLAQGGCPAWRPFSDKVLIALISSMTVNLIGTLYIVLKYIFRYDQTSQPPK